MLKILSLIHCPHGWCCHTMEMNLLHLCDRWTKANPKVHLKDNGKSSTNFNCIFIKFRSDKHLRSPLDNHGYFNDISCAGKVKDCGRKLNSDVLALFLWSVTRALEHPWPPLGSWSFLGGSRDLGRADILQGMVFKQVCSCFGPMAIVTGTDTQTSLWSD